MFIPPDTTNRGGERTGDGDTPVTTHTLTVISKTKQTKKPHDRDHRASRPRETSCRIIVAPALS